jgi:hypothetical protein
MRTRSLALGLLVLCAGATSSQATVLWDQLSNAQGTGPGFASQQFEASFTGYNIASIDDFTLGVPSTIQSVDFPFFYYNGSGPVNTWRIEIYSSPAAALASGTGLAGDVASVQGIAGGQAATPYPNFISVPVNIPLAAGTYWIGIIGQMDFGTGGQVAVMGETNITGAGAMQVNPGGNFGLPGNLAPMASAGVAYDMAYRLNGVPAPASLALVGLGGLVGMRRRR